jgi:hypothetical protein
MPINRTPKRETRKNAATIASTASNPSVRPCTTVQDPPGPSRDAKTPLTCTDDGKKNFHQNTTTAAPTETTAANTLTEAEQLMFQALEQLQKIYDASCKTKANKITIERAMFEKITTTFQQAYEQIKTKASTPTPTPAPENVSILDTLQQIKVSITNLEAMQATRNAPNIDRPAKTYADAIKTSVTAAQLHKQQEQERIRAQRIQSTITLNTTETNDKVQQWFQTENNEKIAISIQKAIENQLNISCAILGISKQQNTIKIHHRMCDKDADEVEQNMNWNAIAEGLKPHEDIHGVVVYGVPKDIDITDPQIIESLKEANHCIKPDAIDRITPLRRNPTAAEYQSIIVFSKYPEELNTWIEQGFSINYQIYRTQRFTKRTQLIQCFNCYGYGHHAKTCQAKTCCGKCGESHETQNCKNTTVKCCQCKGPHEAWHYKCPIKLMKRKILREIRHQLPYKFIVPKHAFQERESEEEEEEESPPNFDDNKYPFTPKFVFSGFGNPVPTFGTSSY